MNNRLQPASLTFEYVTFGYDAASDPVVTDIHVHVHAGELVVLVGPSGCGKSTLLRLVAGLVQPVAGRVWIGDDDMRHVAPEKRQIGWVPQSYALFDHLDVAGNISFGLRMRNIARDQRAQRVQEMLELCHIADLAHRTVSALSGGQRQRVAIARALAVYPRVLLLDEPLAALDPQLRLTLRTNLEQLLRISGVTTLFVTHDQSEALAIADRIVVLRDGRVQQYGTPQQVWDHPANAFVATFISGAHVLHARRVGETLVEIAPGLVAHIPAAQLNGHAVELALRPGDLQPDPDGSPLVVAHSEYAGGRYLTTGQIPGGPRLSFFAERLLAVGTIVPVGLKPDVHLAVIGT